MNRSRAAVVGLLVALLVLAAAAAGFFLAARYGPDRAARWVEAQLEEQIGPVEIGSLHVGFHWGPAVEARDLRAAAAPDGSGGRLEAASGTLSFDLTRLLRGELRVGRVKLTGLRAEFVRDADGQLHPEAARRLLDLASAARAADKEGSARSFAPREALDALRSVSAVLPALAIVDGEIHWRDAGSPTQELGVRELEASLGRTRLGGGLGLTASGRVLADGADVGRFELQGELPRLGEPKGQLGLADFDLAAAHPWLERWAPAREADLELAGRTGAHLAWRADGANDHIDAELIALDLRVGGRFASDRPAQRAELPSARVAASFTVEPRAVEATSVEVDLGPWRLRGHARSARPLGARAAIDFRVRGEPVAATTVGAALRAVGEPALTRVADAISAGRLAAWSLGCDGVRGSVWSAVAAAPLDAWPEACALELGLEGVTVQQGGDQEPIRGLSGQLVLRHDRLTLRDVHARIGDRPLPALDLTVTGIAAVAKAIADGETPHPVPPLPGWFTLERWAKGDREPGAPARWQRAEIEASRLDHPILMRPVSGLRAVLLPVPFGFDAEILEAHWGSARVHGRARKSGDPPGRIEVEATAVASAEPAPRDLDDPAAWARANFRVELQKLGPFRASEVTGRVRIEEDRGRILEGDARLLPRGRLLGEVDLTLDHSEFVPATGRLRVEGASLPDLLEDLKLDREVMTGTVHLSGDVDAKLIPRANILRELTGPVTLELRDGEIRKRMNLLLALAAASDTFNPFRSRETLPYDEIDGELVIDRGTVRTESLSLVGPAARLVATGDVNVVDPPNEVNAVVGLFFFKTLDTVIGAVPLVNRILLGDDENLMAAYFALSGPWKQPSARILPATLLTSGPVGIVTEGLPGFVRSGIGSLRRLLGGGDDEPARDAKPGASGSEPRP